VLLECRLASFWVHCAWKGVEIIHKKTEWIKKVQATTCKKELQRFLGKVNYLRRIICNLSGKVNAFTPLLRLKSGGWVHLGAKQQEAFDEIKNYLTSPPVLEAPKSGVPFWFYTAAKESVIGAVLTQESDGKEYIVALKVEDCWTPKQGTHSLKSYVYLFIMLVPSCGIICYQLLVM
jgi:hypothetical protein